MEGERVTSALWYRALLRSFPALAARAAAEALFVCIPQTASLSSTALRESDVLHHLIRASAGGVRGKFETLSGRRCTVTGAEIITGDGFPRRVTARIIGSDRIRHSPTGASGGGGGAGDSSRGGGGGALVAPAGAQPPPQYLRVYFLSRPLEGGVEAPPSADDIDHGDVLKTVAMLRASPETEVVFDALQDAVALARLDLAALRPGEDVPPSVDALLRAQVDASAEALLGSLLFGGGEPGGGSSAGSGGDGGGRGRTRAHLVRVLECWATEQLHGLLLPALAASPRVAPDVAALAAVFGALRGWSAADFKVKPAFRCNLQPAVAALGLLASAATPLEKLHCLRDTSLTLQRCVERHCEATGVDLADVEYATDDILDMLLWVLVAGGAHHATHELPAHLAYVARFHMAPEAELVTSRLGYYMANFEQCVGYFLVNADELRAQARARACAAPLGGGGGDGVGPAAHRVDADQGGAGETAAAAAALAHDPG